MLEFKLIEVVDGFHHYEIYPSGKVENKTIFVFDDRTKEIKENTTEDKYLNHFLNRMRNEDGTLRESGMVAWG